MTSTIQFPSDLGAGIGSSASGFIANLGSSGYIGLIIGVVLAAVVLEIIIGAIRK